ncbi:hypothetical protein QZH41_017697 [Actinostola sp. cb2023]|nr:hypothetical protein QZH41_017697 [Actinostola sp. cb2023]
MAAYGRNFVAVQIHHVKSGSKYSFKCDRWLSKDEDDHQIIRELPAIGPNVEPLPVYTYRVFVHTGNKRGAGTDADVFITIFGQMGDTGERPLQASKDNTNKFERNQTDEFEIEAVSLEQLKKIRIGHNGTGTGSAWYLNKVVISDPEENTKVYEFPCER